MLGWFVRKTRTEYPDLVRVTIGACIDCTTTTRLFLWGEYNIYCLVHRLVVFCVS